MKLKNRLEFLLSSSSEDETVGEAFFSYLRMASSASPVLVDAVVSDLARVYHSIAHKSPGSIVGLKGVV